MTRRIEFRGDGIRQHVHLDGQDISHLVKGASLEVFCDDLPSVGLDLAVLGVDVAIDDARVHVSDDTKQLLTTLGWTPPEDSHEP